MNRILRILQAVASFLLVSAAWLIATAQALAAAPPPINKEGGGDDFEGAYLLAYMVVVLGIVLGMLVVAKTSNRRDRDRPAGYVEKNIMDD